MSTEQATAAVEPAVEQTPVVATPEVAATPVDHDAEGIAAVKVLRDEHVRAAAAEAEGVTPDPESESLMDSLASALNAPAPAEEPKKEEPAAEPKAKAEEPKADAKAKEEPKEDDSDDYSKAIDEIEDEYGSVVAGPMRKMAAQIKALKGTKPVTPQDDSVPPTPHQAFHSILDERKKYAGMIGATYATATPEQRKTRISVGDAAAAFYRSTMGTAKPLTEEQAIGLALDAIADPTKFRAMIQNKQASLRQGQRTVATGGGASFAERREVPGRTEAQRTSGKSADEEGIDAVRQFRDAFMHGQK